jgi:hypothetical protein
MIVRHLVRLRINLIDPHTRIDIRPRSDRGADEGVGDRVCGKEGGSVVLVEDVEEVFVGVAEEEVTDGGMVALYDDLEEVRGVLQWIGTGPAAVDVL